MSQHPRSEATHVLAQLAKDVPLSEAVLLAIESLGTRQSAHLRRAVELYEPWCEWRDDWASHGWRITRVRKNRAIRLVAPEDHPVVWGTMSQQDLPDDDVVAAGADLDRVKLYSLQGRVAEYFPE